MTRIALPMNKDRFMSGFTWPGYVAQMTVNRELMRQLFGEIAIDLDDRRAFLEAAAHHGGELYLAVLTEDWCGDAVANLPLVARLAAETPGLELRFFLRSINPDLKAAYAADGIGKIPVLSFFDATWREIGRWVERPAAAHERVKAWLADYPEIETLRQSDRPEDRERLKAILAKLLPEMIGWYHQGLWQATLEELKARLQWSWLITQPQGGNK